MAAPRRELKITYGSYVCGAGQAKRQPSGPWELDDSPDAFAFRFELVIFDTSSASDFETELDAALDAFATPFQDFKVELVDPDDVGTTQGTVLSALTSTRSGLNVVATVSQPRIEEGVSSRHAVLEVEVRGEWPADYDAGSLRGDWSYRVEQPDPTQRRILTVKGTYTATLTTGDNTLARAQYEASIAAKVASILSASSIARSTRSRMASISSLVAVSSSE